MHASNPYNYLWLLVDLFIVRRANHAYVRSERLCIRLPIQREGLKVAPDLHRPPQVEFQCVEVIMLRRMFRRRWLLRSLLILGVIAVIACIWARWRPARRFGYREVRPEEFRFVTYDLSDAY